jgi:ElaB/YqjD/DUF883 family membrane-anchored ribosome-binding protein
MPETVTANITANTTDSRSAARAQEREFQRELLARDLRRVIDDAERMLRTGAEQVSDGTAEWRHHTETRVAELRERLNGVQRQTVDRVREASRQTNAFVHDNPWASIGLAAGAAMLAGYLLNGRR